MSASVPHTTARFCRFLEWDTHFFRRRIGRILPARLTRETVQQARAWARANAIDCLYFLADASDRQTIRLAEENGLRFTDIRVTLECALIPEHGQVALSPGIRLCREEDVPALREIARVSHRDSRFYYDGNFGAELCDELYATWIDKSCHDSAQAVLVADSSDGPSGYLSCHRPGDASGQIGLFAVGLASQGRGTGKALLASAMRWFAGNDVSRVTVVTQGRNAPAQRVYQRAGFVSSSVELWYHWWFTPTP